MTINLTLNQEQSDALTAWLAERNAKGADVTAESHLEETFKSPTSRRPEVVCHSPRCL